MTLEEIYYILGIVFMLSYLVVLVIILRFIAMVSQTIEDTKERINRTVDSVEEVVEKLYHPRLIGAVGILAPVVAALWKNLKKRR